MTLETMRTWAEISLDNLEHNYRALRACAPGSRFLGVVKANAYGHGAVPVAKKLEELGADYLAVACLNEALELRDAGITMPLMILGATPVEFADQVVEEGLTQAVFTLELARALSEAAERRGTAAKIHVKVDTGMSRLGLLCHEAAPCGDLVEEICALPGLDMIFFGPADFSQGIGKPRVLLSTMTLMTMATAGAMVNTAAVTMVLRSFV